jgi:transposase
VPFSTASFERRSDKSPCQRQSQERVLSGFGPTTAVERARRDQARDLVGDVRRLDAQRKASKRGIIDALSAVPTWLGELSGVGPVATCIILAHSGDVQRFASEDNHASYNATAPIEASSGPRKRHRLNPG